MLTVFSGLYYVHTYMYVHYEHEFHVCTDISRGIYHSVVDIDACI